MERIALDVHTHLIPVQDAALTDFAGVTWDDKSARLSVDGHTIGIPGLYKPDALVKWMDEQAVERALISAPPPTYRPQLLADEAARWCDALNTGLEKIAARHPSRLSPLFHLTMEHPAVADATARKYIAAGHGRFSMSTGSSEHMLSGAAYEPLWQALDEASAFLFLHPGEGCDGRLDPFYLHNMLGNPAETGIATAHLVFAGIPERYPRITFCLAHAGGITAALAGRWEMGHATSRPGLDTKREAPRAALKRFCVDCIAHDPAGLQLAADVFGANRIVFGSDWPFPMGLLRPHEQLASVPAEQRRRIFCDEAGLAGDR